MIEYYDQLTQEEQEQIQHVIGILLKQTYVLERKYDKRSGRMIFHKEYRICNKHLEFLREYFKIAGIRLMDNSQMGIIYIQGESVLGEKLPKLATIYLLILKLLYDEKMARASTSVNVIVTLGEISGKAGELRVLKGLSSITEIRKTIALLKKYQMIEPLDVLEEINENTRMVVYPSIHAVLLSADATKLLESFRDEDEEEDTASIEEMLDEAVREEDADGREGTERTGGCRWKRRNRKNSALYILDEKLKQVSTLEGLAEDEQIYSARFLGDTAYFVTYKQVDPLFSVDLSNPKKPVILGELKIPGFSEYLHPYSENQLLGIGMDTDEDGMTTNGVKLSMFDITDPSNVSEVNKQVLKDVYGSNVFYDYKAVLIDGEKNLIGFSAHGDSQHYYVYSYDENSGFTCLLDHAIGNSWYGTIRGIYAGNTLYIVEGYAIESYDLTTFDKIDDIVL